MAGIDVVSAPSIAHSGAADFGPTDYGAALEELTDFRRLKRGPANTSSCRTALKSIDAFEIEPTAENLLNAWALVISARLETDKTFDGDSKRKFGRLTTEVVRSKSLVGMRFVQREYLNWMAAREEPGVSDYFDRLKEGMSANGRDIAERLLRKLKHNPTPESLIEAWAFINNFWLDKDTVLEEYDKREFRKRTRDVLKSKNFDEYKKLEEDQFDEFQRTRVAQQLPKIRSFFESLRSNMPIALQNATVERFSETERSRSPDTFIFVWSYINDFWLKNCITYLCDHDRRRFIERTAEVRSSNNIDGYYQVASDEFDAYQKGMREFEATARPLIRDQFERSDRPSRSDWAQNDRYTDGPSQTAVSMMETHDFYVQQGIQSAKEGAAAAWSGVFQQSQPQAEHYVGE